MDKVIVVVVVVVVLVLVVIVRVVVVVVLVEGYCFLINIIVGAPLIAPLHFVP